jgi:hypothetical protein
MTTDPIDLGRVETDAADAFAGYLDELERICQAATPGPWRVDEDGDVRAGGAAPFGLCRLAALYAPCPVEAHPCGSNEVDEEFIAAARHALPKLIAKVRELQARLGNAEALREYADKRDAILNERMASRVCAGCNTKRTGTHCCDCRAELWENDEGVFLGS